MQMLTQESISNALKSVKYPGYSRDIVSFGLVKGIVANQGAVSVTLHLTAANAEVAKQLKTDCEQALRALPGVQRVFVEIKMPAARGAWANPPARSISPARCASSARKWACSTATSTARASR